MSKRQPRSSAKLLRVARTIDGKREVAQILRRVREEAGISRNALAKRLGVKWHKIAEWEDGKRVPIASRFLMFLAACGAEPTPAGILIS